MSDLVEARAARTVLDEANGAHDTRFQLDHRFDGGFQSGAWRLIDDTGRQAVLKWSASSDWAPRIEHAARAVAKIRAAGYPTPAWLAVGTTAAGIGYQIQDFVPGRSPNNVTAREARLLIDLLETHADLDPDPQHCWSRYVTTSMTEQRDDLSQQVARTGSTGRRLVDACGRLLDAHRPVVLPTGDLVHGDFRPGNILFDAGRISGVIDIEALGNGTRAFDYATLLSADEITPEAVELLCTAGEQAAGPHALAYCFVHVILDFAVFVHRRNLQPGIQHVSKLLERMLILLDRTYGA